MAEWLNGRIISIFMNGIRDGEYTTRKIVGWVLFSISRIYQVNTNNQDYQIFFVNIKADIRK